MQYLGQSQDKIVRSLGAGVISACLFLLFMTDLSLLIPFALLPLFYSGLRDNVKSICLTILFAAVVITGSTSFAVAILYCIFFGLPTLCISCVATKEIPQHLFNHSHFSVNDRIVSIFKDKRLNLPNYFKEFSTYEQDSNSNYWYSNSYLINLIAQITLITTIGLTVLMYKMHNQQKLLDVYKNLQATYRDDAMMSHISFEVCQIIYRLIPGFIGIFLFTVYIINGFFGQYILTKTKNNVRPKFGMIDFKLPLWLWVKLLLLIGVSLTIQSPLINQLSMNVVLVLLAVFMLQGMSVIYIFCQQKRDTILYLFGFCLLVLFMPWMTILIIFIGVLEPWLGWRQKMKKDIRS